MSRRRNPVPIPYFLKAKQAWCVNVAGKRIQLGRDRAEVERRYRELFGAAAPAGPAGPPPIPIGRLTVANLVARYLPHAEERCRRHQSPGRLDLVRSTLAVLRDLYGPTRAAELGPKALGVVRDAMAAKGWTRASCNLRLGVLKRLFRWAVTEELIDESVYRRLAQVEGLCTGQAVEGEKVQPAAAADVAATIAACHPVVAAMIRLQQLTGMRSCEVCALRPGDLDTSGEDWLYVVPDEANKTAAYGRRVVWIPAAAREVLAPFLERDVQAYCFSPRDVRTRHGDAERYTTRSYYTAVRRAAQRAGVPHFHPHQLRHAFATEVERSCGERVAQLLLGHRSPRTTRRYVAPDLAGAIAAARRAG